MVEDTNLFGAIVFWLYIVAALFFTFLAIESIVTLPKPAPHKHVATFSILAFISFSALSFNMLHVLVDSYNTWSDRQLAPLPLSPSEVWHWSVTSTLFRNFGEAIVQNDARFLWTQSALLATISISFFMSMRGLSNRIPRLWAFFALSQILPISFAQNLFYIALLRSPNARGTVVTLPCNSTLLVMMLYCLCLFAAPFTAKGPLLMPTILVARLLLFVPFFLPQTMEQKKGPSTASTTGSYRHLQAQRVVAYFAAVMTIKQAICVLNLGYSLRQVMIALFSHPAVTALGFDFILTAVSSAAWIFTERYGVEGTDVHVKKQGWA